MQVSIWSANHYFTWATIECEQCGEQRSLSLTPREPFEHWCFRCDSFTRHIPRPCSHLETLHAMWREVSLRRELEPTPLPAVRPGESAQEQLAMLRQSGVERDTAFDALRKHGYHGATATWRAWWKDAAQ